MFTKIKLPLILFLCVSTAASAKPFRRRYKYYLDANTAEQILSGIVLKPRLNDDQWTKILGADRQLSSITIQQGDNLWNLSGKAFQDPFLWRKLWQENPQLTNPHELEVGQILQYYRETPGEAENVIRIPLVKLLPDMAGQAADLDNDSFINTDIKNRFRPTLLVLTDSDLLGEISGSYSDHEGLGDLDKIFIRLKSLEGVKPGAKFGVVRLERKLSSKKIGGIEVGGMLMRLVGEVTVTRVGEKFTEVVLSGQFGDVRRGYNLVAEVKAVQWTSVFNPPEGLKARIVSGEEKEYQHYAQGQLVLLDKGTAEGMKNGFLFRVYRDTDPVTEERAGVPPDYKAEIQVVYAGKLSSVGYILRNSTPLVEGDVCVPAQDFPNPPPPVVKSHDIIEIP